MLILTLAISQSTMLRMERSERKTKMMELKKLGRFFELSEQMKAICHVDLRMTDVADCVIVYINPDIPMCGTIHELVNSLQQRKPTLVVVEGGKKNAPNWLFGIMDFNFMFDSFDDLKDFMCLVDEAAFRPDLTQWVFFDFKIEVIFSDTFSNRNDSTLIMFGVDVFDYVSGGTYTRPTIGMKAEWTDYVVDKPTIYEKCISDDDFADGWSETLGEGDNVLSEENKASEQFLFLKDM